MQNIDMTERRIDGGEVYSGKILHVMVDRVEKIISDVQKFFNNIPIDAMSKK